MMKRYSDFFYKCEVGSENWEKCPCVFLFLLQSRRREVRAACVTKRSNVSTGEHRTRGGGRRVLHGFYWEILRRCGGREKADTAGPGSGKILAAGAVGVEVYSTSEYAGIHWVRNTPQRSLKCSECRRS